MLSVWIDSLVPTIIVLSMLCQMDVWKLWLGVVHYPESFHCLAMTERL